MGHAARERVDGGVQAPVLGVVADGPEQLLGERLLALPREVAGEDAAVLAGRRRGRDERDELVLDRAEEGPELLGREARLVVVEQDVVRVGEFPRAVEAGDVAVRELEDALQRGLEEREVGLLARGHPGLLRVGVGARDLRREVGRDVDRLVVVAPEVADQRGVVGLGVGLVGEGLQGIEQLAEPRVGDATVDDPLERLELIRPRVGAARRHHRVLIPQEQAADPAQISDLPRPLAQLDELLGLAQRPARA